MRMCVSDASRSLARHFADLVIGSTVFNIGLCGVALILFLSLHVHALCVMSSQCISEPEMLSVSNLKPTFFGFVDFVLL